MQRLTQIFNEIHQEFFCTGPIEKTLTTKYETLITKLYNGLA